MPNDLIRDLDALPLLDKATTAVLRESIGDEKYAELFATLPAEVSRLCDALSSYCTLSPIDRDGIRAAAHALKGVAANYGVVRLEAVARALGGPTSTEGEMRDLVAYLKNQLALLETAALDAPDDAGRVA
ncbi:MAG: Hpt domain-containing protein [Alphaproteobacteria bacterium]|nr:Hpt domain-containing protein [Alphaproteobacteria bacterium]